MIIKLPFIRSNDQLTDMMMKAISSKSFYNLLDKLGIKDIYTPI